MKRNTHTLSKPHFRIQQQIICSTTLIQQYQPTSIIRLGINQTSMLYLIQIIDGMGSSQYNQAFRQCRHCRTLFVQFGPLHPRLHPNGIPATRVADLTGYPRLNGFNHVLCGQTTPILSMLIFYYPQPKPYNSHHRN